MSTSPAALSSDAITALRTQEHEAWKQQEDAADLMVPLIGRLYRQRNVITTLFGKGLVHKNSIEIIKHHSFVCKYVGTQMMPRDTLVVLDAVLHHAPHASAMRIDVARTLLLVRDEVNAILAEESEDAKAAKVQALGALLDAKMAPLAVTVAPTMTTPSDVILYGFGRIGRLLARLLIEKSGPGVKLMLRAIVVRKGSKEDLAKRASLLRRDSVHGPFHGSISFNEEANAIIANGNLIQIIYSDGPDKCDYTQYGIQNAVVIDNTGIWRDEAGLSRHLQSPGVAKVILTAPGKGNIPTIVAGVNDHDITSESKIFSAASCTTNAIAPVLKALEQKYGIVDGHIETVHSFTNDQNLIDNYHPKERRGRSAVLNMVITETGAASAVSKCLPTLKGKLTANAIRVPTPNVSLAILNLHLSPDKTADLTVASLNKYLSTTSLNSPLQNQIDFVQSAEVASSDFVGARSSGTIDGKATIVQGNKIVLYVWYDNEFGYSCQVVRVLQTLEGIKHTRFPDASQVEAIDKALHLAVDW
jgi:glyceraldehyde 3-phosphate dehydrogenase